MTAEQEARLRLMAEEFGDLYGMNTDDRQAIAAALAELEALRRVADAARVIDKAYRVDGTMISNLCRAAQELDALAAKGGS